MLAKCLAIAALLIAVCAVASTAEAEYLDERLQAEPVEQLIADAKAAGNARQGAVLFYQAWLGCRKCHLVDAEGRRLGPDLTTWKQPATDAELIQAVLDPSKTVRKGFESISLVLDSGKIRTGILVRENDDAVTIRTLEQDGREERIDKSGIEEILRGNQSLMPKGLVNQLANRQQFLDLIRYLMAIRDGGVRQARLLEPLPHLYATPPIPAYESDVDHAGLIRDLSPAAFRRGEAIYQRLCVNCHGTRDKPGSLPTSLRFASGRFRSGSDPFTMYQTLTRGFGMMQPQAWMVPQQKYDVIHYIREAYLKPYNPAQYFDVTDEYLKSLPAGNTRGPAPQPLEPWVTMNYGDSLINTYEAGRDGTNFAYKGIAVRLDPGPGGVSQGNDWMIFDHDTLRMAAAWSGKGFIDWNGIHFNGRHQVHPRLAGDVKVQNPNGPGWANPETGGWDDPRIRGRDGKHYGPLPREWGHYRGLYVNGNRRVISYSVGKTDVLESPLLPATQPVPIFARQIRVGRHSQPLVLQVASVPADCRLHALPEGVVDVAPAAAATADNAAPKPFRFDGRSFAQIDDAVSFDLTRKSFTITARIRTKSGGTIFSKTENGPKWVPDGKALFVRGGRLCYDIGWVGVVSSRRSVNDGRWHDVALTWDHETSDAQLYIDGRADSKKRLRPKRPQPKQVVRIGFAAPNFPGPQSHFEGDIDSVRFFARVVAPTGADRAKPIGEWKSGDIADERLPDRIGKHDAYVVRGSGGRPDDEYLLSGIIGGAGDGQFRLDAGRLVLEIPPSPTPVEMTLWFAAHGAEDEPAAIAAAAKNSSDSRTPLEALLGGGPALWPEIVETEPVIGGDEGPFAADVLTRPKENPWKARVRLTGFDFFDDGDSAAICAWDGDVWKVTGINSLGRPLTWQRIASGLFQPLGVKIVDGAVYVTCRDQIVILRDLNGDGETDFYENFNNDHQVTEHFHEFAMGLQRDEAGNFYYAKSARHALPAIVPHHGTLLRVSPDGRRTDIVANGFRAANGVCLNPDGTFIVTDQEGHWNPKNRINWVHEGGFYGNMFGYTDVTDSSDDAMEQPLCWITNDFDRSPAELLWVPKDCWGKLGGSLLNLSYGYGKVYLVLHENVDGQMQGGMIELPLPQFPTGLIRGRFHPTNGHLYTCGMFAWAGNQQQPGGFYRIRRTEKPLYLPFELHARAGGVELVFTEGVDRASAMDAGNYGIRAWDLKRTANYGSKHYNEREWAVESVEVSEDGKTVFLSIPEIAPTWGMEIRYFLKTPAGAPVEGRIHNTIHRLPDR